MKIPSIIILLSLIVPMSAEADQYVNGYFRKNGTYVQPHYRSSPDNSIYNNYSYQGNLNPYTGGIGHKNYNSGSTGGLYLNNNYGVNRQSPNYLNNSIFDDD